MTGKGAMMSREMWVNGSDQIVFSRGSLPIFWVLALSLIILQRMHALVTLGERDLPHMIQ